MFEHKLKKVKLKNFKCHRDSEIDLEMLTILAGSNAAGKSSFIQSVLLAVECWNNAEKKNIRTNNIFGINLGLPINVISEEFTEDESVVLQLISEKEEKTVVLKLDDTDESEIYFKIDNLDDIIEEKEKPYNSLDLKKVFFLNAERKGPRIISVLNEMETYSVGYKGENTSYVISEFDKLQKLDDELKLPEELRISTMEKFSANCEEWLEKIIPGTGFQYSIDMEKNLSTIKYRNNGEFYLPTATGFGITYVLPIVVQVLAASMLGSTIVLVENPEAHLHPYSQSTLGKFLARAALAGVQIIIETHSEHIIDGCRIEITKNKKNSDMKVLFFEKDAGTSNCKPIQILENGELEYWPEGFFDQKRLDLRELLEMRKCGK